MTDHACTGLSWQKRIALGLIASATALIAPSGIAAFAATAGSLVSGPAPAAAGGAPSIIGNDLCSSHPYGSVIISGSAWAGGMGHPVSTSGATFDVYSNWDGSSCWRGGDPTDGVDRWGQQFQCTELAVRVADLEWNEGGSDAWANVGWDGNASTMFDVAPRLPVPLVAIPNGSGSLPNPGDLMVWGATPSDSTGHVGVVERIDTVAQRVWVVSQNSFNAEFGIPYTGSTVDPTGSFGLPLRGWLDDPRPTRGVALLSDGVSGYTLDGWGGVLPFGGAPSLSVSAYWPDWDIARGMTLLPDSSGGYVVDGFGGVHPFGDAQPVAGTAYWPGWDIARGVVVRSDGKSGYVLDGFGGLHPFGGAPLVSLTAYWPGWDIARAVVLRADGQSGYVLDGYGGLHPFGGAPLVAMTAYWPGWDIARALTLTTAATDPHVPAGSGWVLDGWGGVHPFGGAPPAHFPQNPYFPGRDVARGIAFDPLMDAGVTVNGPSAPAAFHVSAPVRALAYQPGRSSGYLLDGFGGLTPFGTAPALSAGQSTSWPDWDIARGLVLRSDGASGYVLDGFGGIHPVGGAPPVIGTGYWAGQDLARGIVLRADGDGGYVVDAYGGIWPFGAAPAMTPSKTWSTDVARGIVLLAAGTGGYVLDAYGGLHPFGTATLTTPDLWPAWDTARGVALLTDTSGYILDDWGGLHSFGGAPAVSGESYWAGYDVARSVALAPQSTPQSPAGMVADLNGATSSFS